MASGSPLSHLAACAGRWRGTNRLHDPFSKSPEDTSSTLTISPILQGRFWRLDYGWSYQGSPQEGSIVLGADGESGEINAHWIDTWHMSQKAMLCTGRFANDRISALGSYACPPGPDWGWRLEIFPKPDSSLQILMFNVSPQGDAAPAVEASYVPDKTTEPELHARACEVSEIRQIAITVSDVGAALAFYRDVLGLKFLFSAGPNLAFVAAGSVRLMLTTPQGAGKPGANSILYYSVENIEAIHAAIVKRGATSERAPQLVAQMPDHDLWIGFLRDPDGNLVGLMEEKKNQAAGG